MPMTGRRI